MLCPALTIGASSLTFSEAASYHPDSHSFDLLLQPFISRQHIPTPPIATQIRRTQYTFRRQSQAHKISCPFGASITHLLCPLSGCKHCGPVTRSLRAHAATSDWLTHPLAPSISGHTPPRICSNLIILRLTPLSGPCISLKIDPSHIISDLLPLIQHVSDSSL